MCGWWRPEFAVQQKVYQKYVIEIRANEYDFHPPHFHVRCNEFSAVFKLSNGDLYTQGKNKWPPKMINEVKEWYSKHKEVLKESWSILHSN